MLPRIYISRFAVLFTAVLFSLGASGAQANTIPFNGTDWATLGTSVRISADTLLLTPNMPGAEGNAQYSPGICAKEYKILFEMNVGNNISPQGGAGIALAVQDRLGKTLYRAHVDTFYDIAEDHRYEVDGNHVSIDSLGAYYDVYGKPPATGNTTFGPFAAGRMPFTMEGSGWFEGELYVKTNDLRVTFNDGTSGLVLKAVIPYQPGLMLFPTFVGKTESNYNEQKVRNISIELIDRSDCPDFIPPLTQDQARQEVVAACGAVETCPPPADYTACVQHTLDALVAEERIDSNLSQILLLEAKYGLSFCSGYNQCVSDIDPEALQEQSFAAGYQAGVADGTNAGRQEGYQTGYSDGRASGYNDGRLSGYTDGQAAGYASGYSDGRSSGYTEGYASGHSAGVSEGQTAGYASGFSDGRGVGYTAGREDGYKTGYSEGNAAGYAAGQSTGYAEGERAGYQNGYQTGDAAGYERGYDAGEADGKTQGYSSGHDDGYQEGYSSGLSQGQSTGYEAGKTDGYRSGYDAGYATGVQDGKNSIVCQKYLTLQEAQAKLREQCGCDKMKNHGQQVACSVVVLHKMGSDGLISDEMKRTLFREATTAQRCSTNSKR